MNYECRGLLVFDLQKGYDTYVSMVTRTRKLSVCGVCKISYIYVIRVRIRIVYNLIYA